VKRFFIQGCRWHEWKIVTSYLPELIQAVCKRRLQDVYEEPTQDKAKDKPLRIRKELGLINRLAINC
jgi:hypothetical protein